MTNEGKEEVRRVEEGTHPEPDDFGGREPILAAISFYDPSEPERYKQPKRGRCRLPADERTARLSLLSLVLASARYLKWNLPNMFTPDSAEVFYASGRLEEVRLEGRCVTGVDLEGEVIYETVIAGRRVGFTRDPEGKIVLSPQDAGREHLAVRRDGDALWVSWDLTRDESLARHPEAVYAVIKVPFSLGAVPPVPPALERAARLSLMEEELKGVGEEELKRRLMLPSPVEVRRPLNVRMGDGFRTLTYVYEEDEARRRLAQYFAVSADFSVHEIRQVARERSVSFARAKAMLFLENRRKRDDFVEKSLPNYPEYVFAVLADVFAQRLIKEINSRAMAAWKNPEAHVSQTPEEILKGERDEQYEDTGRRFGLRGQGREQGTHPRMREEKVRARREERLGLIRAAMAEVFRDALAGKRIDDESLWIAEDALKAHAVLGKLRIKERTLFRWLIQGGVRFEALKESVTRTESKRMRAESEAEPPTN